MTLSSDNPRLFIENPLDDFVRLIRLGHDAHAQRLLLLAGKYPVCRVNGELTAPIVDQVLHFEQTQALANAILSADQTTALDRDGSVEITQQIDNVVYLVNVFFGNGSHNFVVFYPET